METDGVSPRDHLHLFEAAQRTQHGRARENASNRPTFGTEDDTERLEKNFLQKGKSREEQKETEKLRTRDREVRAHEQAHKAAAGQFARGAATFEYEVGPDGRRYAVGGEVQIDTSEVSGDPQATVQKMRTIQRAALAPADPSSQDRKVASEAGRKAAKAQAEVLRSPEGSRPGVLIDISV